MDTQVGNTYEVALSFAGEQREYVEEVATALQSRGIAVFYDKFEEIYLWGKSLVEELQAVYEHRASRVVIFVSKEWVEKAWPRHERQAALSRAVQESSETILPVRFDDTPVPGLPSDVMYLRAENYTPAELASMIAGKLGITPFAGKASDEPPPRTTSLVSEAVFNYSNYNGRYVIGRETLEFETKWSKASNVSIHVYNDPPSINAIALGPLEWTDISQVVNAATLDYTSRSRTPRVGQIVLFRNKHGSYAAVRLLEIKDNTRGDEHDELRIKYAIQADGSDNFSEFTTAMQLPETKPIDDPESLWALQLELLSMAQSILGDRDQSKEIGRPQFTNNGPNIRNTPNLVGAFAELSRAAEANWPEVVFQMAHETVHLLNPIPGNTNNLEEGVAVAFSLYVQHYYGISVRLQDASYLQAFQLASTLPEGPLESARRVRNRVGALSAVTIQNLAELFPNVDPVVLESLVERFIRKDN